MYDTFLPTTRNGGTEQTGKDNPSSLGAPNIFSNRNEMRIMKFPKAELHIHLEGAIPALTLTTLIQKRSNKSINEIQHEVQKRFQYIDFNHFIESFVWMIQFLQEESDFETLSYDVLTSLAKQNVRYVEPFYSPGYFESHGLSATKITQAVLAGAERAKKDHRIKVLQFRFIFKNEEGPEKGMKWVNELKPFLGKGLIGIGLSENEYPAQKYKEVFGYAKKLGFRLTAHAGESCGSESIYDVMNFLNVDRIGHGVRCIEDEKLIALIKEKNLTLELCPTSNSRTGVVSDIQKHPIRNLFDRGLSVTVNSDNPTFFNCTLTEEHLNLHRNLNFTCEEILELSLNAIRGSFLDEEDKKALIILFQTEAETLCS